MAEIAVASSLFLIDHLVKVLHLEVNLSGKVQTGLQCLETQLTTMQSVLNVTDGRDGDNEVWKVRTKQVRDIAYTIEDTIDEFILHVSVNNHTHRITGMLHKAKHAASHLKALHDMSDKIDTIGTTISAFSVLEPLRIDCGKYQQHQETPPHNLGADATPYILRDEDAILGIDGPREVIIKNLIDLSQAWRKIVAVVGSGGSGKSVLSNMVYNDRRIQSTFDCHAWVHVTRPFKLEDILLNLLARLRLKEGVKVTQEGDDTKQKLISYLKDKKYMIVLDDIWEKEHWEGIVGSLPNGLAGSAILIMSRSLLVVGSSDFESPHYIHKMSKLPKDLATKLFYRKAFHANDGKCPPELEELSSQIIDKCEGIPLSIARIGSLLSKKKLPSDWKIMHDSLGSQMGSNSELSIITKTLLPSYNDLPNHLKSCFLYMGIFHEVKRGRLLRSWIAEGFVKSISGKTQEEVAEDYLKELIGRYLVQTTSLDFEGRPSRCRVTNLVREFIVVKCDENVFLTVLGANTSSQLQGCRRISLFSRFSFDDPSLLMSNRVRTLFTFTRSSAELPKLNNFKLLRVLDMQDSGLSHFPDEICHLYLLKYLSLKRTRVHTVPDSIQKLTCLETLDLKATHVEILPKEIFELRKLRHLFVYSFVVYDYVRFDTERGVEISSGIRNLANLEKLSIIKASSNYQGHTAKFFKKRGSIVEELGKLVRLKKLCITDLKEEDSAHLCSSITNMKSLSTLFVRSTENEYLDVENASPSMYLKRLYLKGRLSKLPKWIQSLHSLVRLGLTFSKLQDNPLNILQGLPNLIELQMIDTFVGYEISFLSTKFVKLKILVIDNFKRLHTIVVQEGALPSLKNLSIRRCENLKMLPLGISFAKKLEDFIIYDMPKEFIAKLERDSEDRQSVAHIPVIHSFTKNSISSNWDFLNHS